MNMFLILAFLFFVGSMIGWVLELFFRRFIGGKWINPGFCVGPYLPLYGTALCCLYLISSLENLHIIEDPILNKIFLLLCMAISMTVIEYIAGIISLKFAKVRLWDYRNEWGNIKGIICPKYSLLWTLLGAVYYFFINPHILQALKWLYNNLAFSFIIGMFYGVFIIDVAYSSQLVMKIKLFAEENDVVVKYENLKAHIRSIQERNAQKRHFLFYLKSERPLTEYLKEMLESFEKLNKKTKK